MNEKKEKRRRKKRKEKRAILEAIPTLSPESLKGRPRKEKPAWATII